jgi:membrane protease YdiL (CAAX protease family)
VWWSLLVAVLIALQYLNRAQAGKPAPNTLYRYSTTANGLIQYGILLFIVLAIAGFSRRLFALRRPRSWLRAIGLCIATAIPLFIAIAIMESYLHGGCEQGLVPPGWEPKHAGAYIANFVLIAGIAPVVEELMFRGLGFSLIARYGTWTAIVVVGAAFALAHGLLAAFPELALFGSALAWIRARTQSVYPGMLVHGVFNGAQLILAVTAQPHSC